MAQLNLSITIADANSLQNFTAAAVKQNMYINAAIEALKSVTHHSISQVGTGTSKYGVGDVERKRINDFITYIESCEIPMRDLFESFMLNTIHSEK